MLAELMRFRNAIAIGGTHGKTTTTSMVATLLDAGGLDPTVINGGIINAYGTNARMGEGEWMVVEADESDGTFLKLPADIAVVTNIDPEHLDHYGTFDKVREAFRQFVENVPFYGFGVMCTRSSGSAGAGRPHRGSRASSPMARTRRPTCASKTTAWTARRRCSTWRSAAARPGEKIEIRDLRLPMPGRHNVSNATAAIAVANELGISADDIRKGLLSFGGVKRRFTHTGSWNGVEIFDDYGHHPVEIKAVLRAARDSSSGRVIAIAQPHRFTRLRDLFDDFSSCFNDADTVIVAPVYAAGEDPIDGVNSEELAQRIRAGGHRDARYVSDPRRSRRWCANWPSPATSSFFSAPATLPNGPMRCRGNWRPRRGRGMSWGEALLARLGDRLAGIRGRMTPDAEMDKITWFRAGGPAQALFQPADEDDLVAFLKAVPEDVPLTMVGVGSNLLVREGGIPGFVDPAVGQGFRRGRTDLPKRGSAPGRPCPTSASRHWRSKPASAASISITAFPAPSAARCA